VYGEQTAVVVVFVSAEYAEREWTRLERRAAFARAMQVNREYVLPVRFDDTLLPGLSPDMAVIDLRTRPRSPEQVAELIARKLEALGITGPTLAAGASGQASQAREVAEPLDAARRQVTGAGLAQGSGTSSASAAARSLRLWAGRRRRIGVVTAASAVLLASLGAGIWLSQDQTPYPVPPLTVNTCARTAARAAIPVKIGSITVGTASTYPMGVMFSPDCRVLATEGDGEAQVWNMVTGHRIATLQADPGGRVFGLAFTPDDQTLAIAGGNGTTSLWDAENGQLKTSLNSDPGGRTQYVCFSPDGRVLFTGGPGGVVGMWDVATHQQIREIKTTSGIGSIAISPNGKFLATGGYDGNDRLSNPVTGKLIATMPGHEGNVWEVAFSPDSTTLAVGTQDGFVQWWDVAHRRLIVQEPGDGTVTNLAFSPKVLATAGNGVCQLWDDSTHKLITTLNVGATGHWSGGLAFSRYGGILAVGWEGTLQFWDSAGAERISG
jgi:hypothetical protein